MSEDRDRVEETPTERLLREAFAARAGQVTAQSLRPAAPPRTRIRRLKPVYAVAVPLFGLAAGLAGWFTLDTTPTAMKHDSPPAATVTASPTVDLQLPADPTSSPSASPSTTPGAVPAIAQDYRPSAVRVAISGLDNPGRLQTGADPVTFQVTWTNTTEVSFGTVVPSVFEGARPPAACTGGSQVQRDSGDGWKDVPRVADDPTELVKNADGAFPLGPGESRTVKYRLRLDANHPLGPTVIKAAAYGMPADQQVAVALGTAQGDATVVDERRPTVVLRSGPTETYPGRSTSELEVEVRNGTGARMSAAAPTIGLYYYFEDWHVPEPAGSRLTVQASIGGQWRELGIKTGCDGQLTVDTTPLQQALAPGAAARFTVRVDSQRPNMVPRLGLLLGATADRHDSATTNPEIPVSFSVPSQAPGAGPSATAAPSGTAAPGASTAAGR